MEAHPLSRFWPLIYSLLQELWSITEPRIEATALRARTPVELYHYAELGLDEFSIRGFQKRDPYSNRERFEKLFARLVINGWIAPMPDGSYLVTAGARQAAYDMIQAGDHSLADLTPELDLDLQRLATLLQTLVEASRVAPEPPEQWAVLKRFRVANAESPVLAQIREALMDLFAYRDDSHYAASRPHFGEAGIVWSVLGALWNGEAMTAEQMVEKMAVRGYDVADYEVALQAAVELGWAETGSRFEIYHLTEAGRALREQAEHLTNEYFFRPWSALQVTELKELYQLLVALRDQLRERSRTQQHS